MTSIKVKREQLFCRLLAAPKLTGGAARLQRCIWQWHINHSHQLLTVPPVALPPTAGWRGKRKATPAPGRKRDKTSAQVQWLGWFSFFYLRAASLFLWWLFLWRGRRKMKRRKKNLRLLIGGNSPESLILEAATKRWKFANRRKTPKYPPNVIFRRFWKNVLKGGNSH